MDKSGNWTPYIAKKNALVLQNFFLTKLFLGSLGDIPHPKTGATALHVAAAKGYTKVIHLLLQTGAQVNLQVSC